MIGIFSQIVSDLFWLIYHTDVIRKQITWPTDKPDCLYLQCFAHPTEGGLSQLLLPQHHRNDGHSEACLPSDWTQSNPAPHRRLHWDIHKVPHTTLSSLPLCLGTNPASTCSGSDLCEEWRPLIQVCGPLFNQHISSISSYFLFQNRW